MTLRQALVITLAGMLFPLGCSHKTDEQKSNSADSAQGFNMVTEGRQHHAHDIAVPPDSSKITDSAAAAWNYIGVVSSNGLLKPIAKVNDKGEWSAVWPEPADPDSVAPRPIISVPRRWRYVRLGHAGDDDSILLRWLGHFRESCTASWAYVTDRADTSSMQEDGILSADAFALSTPFDTLHAITDGSMIVSANATLDALDLVSNGEEGETSRRFELVGYFSFRGMILGLGFDRGYEGESYVIFNATPGKAEVLVSVPGGGC